MFHWIASRPARRRTPESHHRRHEHPRHPADTRARHARRHPQRRDHRARRPRQDDADRRAPAAVGPARAPRRAARPRHGLERAGAREGHHHSRQEHRRARGRGEGQHHRHARPRRLRRRGRARADHGRRRAAARRCERGATAADALRATQGAGARPADHPRHQQGRPLRRAYRGGRRRGLRVVPGPRRDRGADRLPDRLLRRARRDRLARPGRARRGPPAARRPAAGTCPSTDVRAGPRAAGARHEPRRVAVRGPPRAVPGGAGHAQARRAGRVVPPRRLGGARYGEQALRHRGP